MQCGVPPLVLKVQPQGGAGLAVLGEVDECLHAGFAAMYGGLQMANISDFGGRLTLGCVNTSPGFFAADREFTQPRHIKS